MFLKENIHSGSEVPASLRPRGVDCGWTCLIYSLQSIFESSCFCNLMLYLDCRWQIFKMAACLFLICIKPLNVSAGRDASVVCVCVRTRPDSLL